MECETKVIQSSAEERGQSQRHYKDPMGEKGTSQGTQKQGSSHLDLNLKGQNDLPAGRGRAQKKSNSTTQEHGGNEKAKEDEQEEHKRQGECGAPPPHTHTHT